MKRIFWLTAVLISFGMQSSCSSPNCGKYTNCWHSRYEERCPCEQICDACTASEPACRICYECVNHRDCGLGSSKLYGGTKD